MNSGNEILNLILLVICIVVFLKLRSVLGRRTGSERPPYDPYSAPEAKDEAQDNGNVIPLPGSRSKPEADIDAQTTEPASVRRVKGVEPGSAMAQQLTELALADRTFEPANFLEGAQMAYEMIVTGFAAGDKSALKPLLAKEVFQSFEGVIDARNDRNEKVDMVFVGLKKAEFVKALAADRRARVTVRFVSEQTSCTKNADGVVIEGDPVTVRDVTDVWTFEREISARDPNWQLIATSGA
ncbi:MAG: Tim44/TimA family putative adaptor protein [Parvibaculum sp.]